MRILMVSVVLSGLSAIASAPFLSVAILHRLGADDRMVAMLNCLTTMSILAAVPGAWILRRLSPRVATVALLALARLGIPAVLAVWLARDHLGPNAVWLTCTVLALASLFGGSLAGPHDAWMRAVIPSRLIGGFLGRRFALSTVISGISFPLAGMALERWGDAAIAPLLLWGLLLGAAEIPMLLRVGDGRSATAPVDDDISPLSRWRDQRFRHPLVTQLPLFAATAMTAPWLLVALYDLGFGSMSVAVVVTAQTLATAAGLTLGGKRADRCDPLVQLVGLGRWRAVNLVLFGIAVAIASGHQHTALPMLVITSAIDAGLAGATTATAMRFGYRHVTDGSSSGFAMVGLLRGLAMVAGTVAGTALGSLAVAQRGALTSLLPWCHYLLPVIAVSALATWAATVWMHRRLRA
jgi:hypothetical protein